MTVNMCSYFLLGVAAFIEKRGYLYKMGGKHRTWHLRYFILQPGMFTYYKNDPVSVYTRLLKDTMLFVVINCFSVFPLKQKGKILGEVKLSKRTKIQFPKTGLHTQILYIPYSITLI